MDESLFEVLMCYLTSWKPGEQQREEFPVSKLQQINSPRFGAEPSGNILFICIDSCVSHKDAFCLHRNCKRNVLLTFG